MLGQLLILAEPNFFLFWKMGTIKLATQKGWLPEDIRHAYYVCSALNFNMSFMFSMELGIR